MVIYNPAKFCGCRQFSSGDIMVLLCHMILHDHMTACPKGHVTLWVGAHQDKLPSCQVWWP